MKEVIATIALAAMSLSALSVGASDTPSDALTKGREQLAAGHYEEAAKSYEAAFTAGFMPHEAALGAAEAMARSGNAEAAAEWLKNAARAGFRDYDAVRQSEAFGKLLADESFATMVGELEALAHPCRDAEHRALDFWVGNWNVRDTKTGNPAGRSSIEIDMDGCVVVENWTGRTGWTGRSFNVLRSDTGRWQQTWADSSGQIYDFEGQPSTNRMIYTRVTKTKESGDRIIRMTLSKGEDGNVRQLSERSDDGGKSWEVNYDFTYVPRK